MAGKYLGQLEADLKIQLMQRCTRNLSLTDADRAYHLRYKHILEEFDDANREASGKLRVAAPVSFGAMHVQDVVKRYLGERLQVDRDVSARRAFCRPAKRVD